MDINFDDINVVIRTQEDIIRETKFKFDEITQGFVEKFIKEYYVEVGEGLLETTDIEKKNKILKKMASIFPNENNCILYEHIIKCMENSELSTKQIMNDVLKLRACENMDLNIILNRKK